MDTRVLIIGVGNPDRGDDVAGLAVARALTSHVPSNVTIRESSGDGAALLSDWQGFDVVILIDATPPAGRAGCIRRFDAGEQPLPANFFTDSTHAFGVAQGVEMARALGMLPPKLIIYGVEGRDFAIGTPMSGEISDAIPQVTAMILAQLG